ncbi:MAG: SOS response-associated peptidase [Hyphomicrobiaceae bacterium]
MCSRYSLTSPPEAVRSYFALAGVPDFPPRYNIAPSQAVGIVRADARGEREFHLVRWGLVPSWVKDPTKLSMIINARAETVTEKPSFRGAIRHRRCLVPTNGFYEWTGAPGAKTPHLIRRPGTALMGMAGLWEHWVGADGSEIETMAILTTAANRAVASVHDRMPVILAPEHFDLWLDCRSGSAVAVLDLLAPAPEDLLEIVTVSRRVSNARNEGPELWEGIGDRLL